MLKKTLLATAVAGLAVQGASAASFQSWATTAGQYTAVTHSQQGIDGIADTTGNVTSASLLVLGAEYAQNDLITFTTSSDVRTNYSWPTSMKSIAAGTATIANEYEVGAAGSTDTCATTAAEVKLVATNDGNTAWATAGDLLVGEQFKFGAAPGAGQTYTIISKGTAKITFLPKCTALIADSTEVSVQKKALVSLGLVSSTATAGTYRVSSIDTSGTNGSTTIGAMIQTPPVEVTSAGLVAAGTTGVTMTTSAQTGAGTAMDANTGSLVIAKAADEFPVAITKFNGIVDVEQSQLALTGGTSTASTDCVDFNTTTTGKVDGDSLLIDASGALTLGNTVTGVDSSADTVTHKVAFSGGYSFMDTTPATAGMQGLDTTGSDAELAITSNTAMTELTAVDATAINDGSTPLCLKKVIKANTIPTGSFSGSSTYTWTNGASTTGRTSTTTHADLGSWTLNGASVTVYGVPMGSTVDRMIWVDNKGATDAAITGTYTQGGVTTSNLAMGTAAALSSTSVDEALDTALTAAGVTPAANSRATLVLTAPIRSADMVVSASYKVISANDRLSLSTSDDLDDTISTMDSTSATNTPTYTSK